LDSAEIMAGCEIPVIGVPDEVSGIKHVGVSILDGPRQTHDPGGQIEEEEIVLALDASAGQLLDA